MPSSFQPPAAGQVLNAQPELYASMQHERAAEVVNRAQRWIANSAHTMSGGPDKVPLRRLLSLLTIALFGVCLGSALFNCITLAGGARSAPDEKAPRSGLVGYGKR